jgi:hypothetical protein
MPNKRGRKPHPQKYQVMGFLQANPNISYGAVAEKFGVPARRVNAWARLMGLKVGRGYGVNSLLYAKRKREASLLTKLAAVRSEIAKLEGEMAVR